MLLLLDCGGGGGDCCAALVYVAYQAPVCPVITQSHRPMSICPQTANVHLVMSVVCVCVCVCIGFELPLPFYIIFLLVAITPTTVSTFLFVYFFHFTLFGFPPSHNEHFAQIDLSIYLSVVCIIWRIIS